MQYKINIQFTIITLISIILCTCITAYVFYGALNREVFLDLKLYAEMLASEDLMSDSKLNIPDGIRVTLIDNDGNAIYDSMTDVTALENHNKRPEVIDAFRSGEGQARRRSSTLSNDAYYYAIKLANGYVLRVAKEGSSLTSLITSILPMLAVLLILLSIIFIGFSRVMTNNIVRPISQLAVDTANVNEDEIYPELRPFVKKIQSQHEEILKDVVAPILAEKGITLEVKEVTDYVTPNQFVEAGDVFANYFAHQPYQDSFNAENGTHLVTIAGVHVEPMGLYAGKQADLTALGVGQ